MLVKAGPMSQTLNDNNNVGNSGNIPFSFQKHYFSVQRMIRYTIISL